MRATIREQFTIPGATPGLPGEVINMISPTDAVKGPFLTFLNGPTTDDGANPSVDGANPSVAVGLMGHVAGHQPPPAPPDDILRKRGANADCAHWRL